jgi:hypothetical protein
MITLTSPGCTGHREALPRAGRFGNAAEGSERPEMSESCRTKAARVEVSVEPPAVPLRFALRVPVHAGNEIRRTGNGFSVPDRKFFGSGPRIGNLTGKVTGNPEVHDRRAVANWRFGRQL